MPFCNPIGLFHMLKSSTSRETDFMIVHFALILKKCDYVFLLIFVNGWRYSTFLEVWGWGGG